MKIAISGEVTDFSGSIKPFNSIFCDEKLRKIGSYFTVKQVSTGSYSVCKLLLLFKHKIARVETSWLKVQIFDVVSNCGPKIYLVQEKSVTFFAVLPDFQFAFKIHITKRDEDENKLFLNNWILRRDRST